MVSGLLGEDLYNGIDLWNVWRLLHKDSLFLDVRSLVFPILCLNMTQRKIGGELMQDQGLVCDYAVTLQLTLFQDWFHQMARGTLTVNGYWPSYVVRNKMFSLQWDTIPVMMMVENAISMANVGQSYWYYLQEIITFKIHGCFHVLICPIIQFLVFRTKLF